MANSSDYFSSSPFHSRREFLKGLGFSAAAWYLLPSRLLGESSASSDASARVFGGNAHYPSYRAPLTATPYVALPLGAIQARGWLLKQLELQRDGLTGHAEELTEWMPAFRDSGWLGGKGEKGESAPYYLKGLIPLAYILDDERLKKKAQVWIEAILASQQPNGHFGPPDDVEWWSPMIVTYLMRDYHEATGDPRVLPFLTKYYGYMAQNLPQRSLVKWDKARAADEIDTVLWLYNRTGDASLIPVARLLRDQAYDWPKAFRENQFCADKWSHHTVNVSQALKAPATYHLLSGESAGTEAYSEMDRHLNKDHGLIMGVHSGTEHLAGKSPSQGVETCSIVERMLSNETNLRIFGDPQWGDNLEQIAFNTHPAALSDTIQQHVYYTRPNHPSAVKISSGLSEDHQDDFVPAPRSGFPCCCYNLHMGWPKYVQNSWAATHDNGLAILAYGPSQVTAKVGPSVTMTQETDYPFNETIRLKLSTPSVVQFPLELRIPQWCASPRITVAGQPMQGVKPGSFCRIDRQWKNGDEVVINFPMELRATKDYLQTVTLERGPLIYSLQIKANKKVLKSDPRGFDQYELTPATPWNYALDLDPKNPAASVQVEQKAMPENPFVAKTTPVQLIAKARRLPQWTFARNGTEADEPPYGPVVSTEREETVRLVPFGAQFLRITQFPYLGTPPVPPRSFQEDFSGDTFGDRWTLYGPGWYLDQGSLCCRAKHPAKIAAVGTHFADFVYEAQMSVPAKGHAGLLFRASKLGFGDLEFNGYYLGLSADGKSVVLGKSDGAWTELKRATFPIEANTVYPLRISASGSKIAVYMQDLDKPLLTIDDNTYSAGTIGVRQVVADYTVARFQNVSVKAV
jgi:Beta-L-arabinofuranosidase, GH127